MLVDSVKMGFSDLRKRKFRTALTAFSIAIGTMLLIVMFGLGEGIQKIYEDNVNSFGDYKMVMVNNREPGKTVTENEVTSYKEGKDKKIDNTTVETIKKINGVNSVVIENDTKITGTKIGNSLGKKTTLTGRDASNTIFTETDIKAAKSNKKRVNKSNNEPIIDGKNLEKGDINSVLVGQKYLEKMGITDYKSVVGKDIELNVEMPKVDGVAVKAPLTIKAKIAGVINANFNEASSILTSIELASKVQGYYIDENDYLNKKGYSSINVECKDLKEVKSVNDEISKMGYETYASSDNASEMNKGFTVVKAILATAGIIVLLVSAIGVINTMTMTVYEKTKSIGIMKAQGASKRHINVMFVVQSGVLGFIGGVVGSILAVIASIGLDKFVLAKLAKKGVDDVTKLFYTPLWAIGAAVGFAVVICLIAGLVPARRAAKLNPVDSLRYE